MIEPITDDQFDRFRRFIFDAAGISMADEKKTLVATRLAKRLRHHDLKSYGDYFKLMTAPDQTGEFQIAVDLLTTNETYFYREPAHFEVLARLVREQRNARRTFRVWSAASSSGEEVYTIAMILAEELKTLGWEVVGTDLSSRMVLCCEQAVYSMARAEKLPKALLHKYCLKGKGQQEGLIKVSKELRARCRFARANLLELSPGFGKFDVIFLRNVMIYFNGETKKKVVSNVSKNLNPGGYLFISHSESLHGISTDFETVAPAVYRLKERGK
ncbi:MAG: protein-glutamate O-methyltransferase CheR [Halieaceae bacterium]|jgi:chemotaxis protein methyltransferase CheR|nr:protein-glutamate O-methyltransferase CheR [Halieaceae bacterium]